MLWRYSKVGRLLGEFATIFRNDAHTLLCSKVQARFAFATYLTRVQHRLMAETSGGDEDDAEAANEQMVKAFPSCLLVS
jgi:hypothetical protein